MAGDKLNQSGFSREDEISHPNTAGSDKVEEVAYEIPTLNTGVSRRQTRRMLPKPAEGKEKRPNTSSPVDGKADISGASKAALRPHTTGGVSHKPPLARGGSVRVGSFGGGAGNVRVNSPSPDDDDLLSLIEAPDEGSKKGERKESEEDDPFAGGGYVPSTIVRTRGEDQSSASPNKQKKAPLVRPLAPPKGEEEKRPEPSVSAFSPREPEEKAKPASPPKKQLTEADVLRKKLEESKRKRRDAEEGYKRELEEGREEHKKNMRGIEEAHRLAIEM